MLRRGCLRASLSPSELLEAKTNRRIFIRGVNVPAKLPPYQHNLQEDDLLRLCSWGFTVIRLVVTWEALEPAEGSYSVAYMQYILETVRLCERHGVSVIVDPHQDCWSRFTGGDGAPAWTMERLGFRMNNLEACGATLSDRSNPMLWATNYQLFGSAAMCTLFFGSRRFAPDVRVDGHPAQDWLQSRFIAAFSTLAKVLREQCNVLGFGTLNEPSLGWIGVKDIRRCAASYRFGYALSPLQCIRLAAGQTETGVVFYRYPFVPWSIRTLNPDRKVLCTIWPEDLPYDHFALRDTEDAPKDFLGPFWTRFGQSVRHSGGEDLLIFTEPPPIQDAHVCVARNPPEVLSPHFYDLVSTSLQRFVPWLAIDPVTGWPGFNAGETRRRVVRRMLEHGVVIGETGVCWMGAHTDAAMDATFEALEAALAPAVLIWCYVPGHKTDDGWNRENFSIWSDQKLRITRAVRPYAMRVAGKPVRMAWEKDVFVLEFNECHDVDSNETVLFLTHRPCERIEVSDGRYERDGPVMRYIHKHKLRGMHSIRVSFTSRNLTTGASC